MSYFCMPLGILHSTCFGWIINLAVRRIVLEHGLQRTVLDIILLHYHNIFNRRIRRHKCIQLNWESFLHYHNVYRCNCIRRWNEWANHAFANLWPGECQITRKDHSPKSIVQRVLTTIKHLRERKAINTIPVQQWLRRIDQICGWIAKWSAGWGLIFHLWKDFQVNKTVQRLADYFYSLDLSTAKTCN